MSLHGNDVCLLEVEDYNLYEEEASDHAFTRYGPGVVAVITLKIHVAYKQTVLKTVSSYRKQNFALI